MNLGRREGHSVKKRANPLPNIITGARFALVAPFLWILAESLGYGSGFVSVWVYILFVLICLTDLLDGAAARGLNAQSALGAAMDITADGLFIFSSYVLFNIYGVLPVWFTVFVAVDYLVFICTSKILIYTKRESGRKSFVFDAAGRVSAVLFYLMPAAACLAWGNPGFLSIFVLNALLYASVVLACIAISKRCLLCFTVYRSERQM